MQKLTAKPVYSKVTQAYSIKLYDGETLIKTLPCLHDRGWDAACRAAAINDTGKDPYGYH